MAGGTILRVEREYACSRDALFRAFTEPQDWAEWFAPEPWRVDPSSIQVDPRLGGRIRLARLAGDESAPVWGVDSWITEICYPELLVVRERIYGLPGIEEVRQGELRVDFIRLGDRYRTLVRISEGPFPEAFTEAHALRWRSILDRLERYIDWQASVATDQS